MKKLIIGLVSVGVLVLIVWLLWPMAEVPGDNVLNDEVAEEESDIDSEEVELEPANGVNDANDVADDLVTVSYDNNGFSPAEVVVSLGTTVVFENNSDRDMWVGSDPHPTHTDLPAFDQRQSGDSYQFTFERLGQWGYHNHLFPAHVGVVVVEE